MSGVSMRKCFSLNARITLYIDAHNMRGIWERGLAKREGLLYTLLSPPQASSLLEYLLVC